MGLREVLMDRTEVDRLIDAALVEDVGLGDVTTRSLVTPTARGTARVLTREALTVAGLDLFASVFQRVDRQVEVVARATDGDRIEAGETLSELEGPLASILTAERVALNFLQRLSGVATLTRRYVEEIPSGCPTVIVDTRKTTPGLRALERYAVRCGGGLNHRPRLDGGVLIKDNHIVACGSVAEAVRRAKAAQGPALRIEVEVTTLDELEEAIAAGAEVVMLDNMDLDTTREAMTLTKGKVLVEVSGRMAPEQVAPLARLGVHFISVGALTHSARAIDLSLQVEMC